MGYGLRGGIESEVGLEALVVADVLGAPQNLGSDHDRVGDDGDRNRLSCLDLPGNLCKLLGNTVNVQATEQQCIIPACKY